MANIVGSSSAETLANNAGVSDTITGLAGHDIFVYSRSGNAETDTLTDFGSTYFHADMDASQETPPNLSDANGTLDAALSRGNDHLLFSIHENGLDLGSQTGSTSDDVQLAHFHVGAEDTAGPVVFGFIGSPNNDTDGDTVIDAADGEVFGEWDAGEGSGTTLTAQIAHLLAGDIYVNFHTVAHGQGEIRGQVVAVDSGLDRIDVRGANIGSWETMQLLLTESAGTARFSTAFNGDVHTMVLSGVAIADLSESDFIFSGNAAQTIIGSAHKDDLFAAGGSDTIQANAGADSLYGESGNDALFGGTGSDVLHGGTGADKFSYTATAETKVGAHSRDVIADFSHHDHDKIDLHLIDANLDLGGNQKFHLAGGAFTNHAGELIQVKHGGTTVVSGDVNGDGHADFEIGISGAPTLVNGDFVF